jgi:hypothetical protein
MVKVITKDFPDGEPFEPANAIWIANSGALEVHDKHDDDDRIVAAFAPGQWVKATVDQ